MKKILVIILVGLLLLLTGCSATSTNSTNQKITKTAMIYMPDGSIVCGECESLLRISHNWQKLVIDGITYRVSDWRVVIIEKPEEESDAK